MDAYDSPYQQIAARQIVYPQAVKSFYFLP